MKELIKDDYEVNFLLQYNEEQIEMFCKGCNEDSVSKERL